MAEDDKKITKEMHIMDIVKNYPDTIGVFQKHGLHCIGCFAAHFESLEEGAAAHGIDIDELVADLNESLNAKKE